MSTFPVNGGNFPFEITSDDNNIDGGLELTYTLNDDGTITDASVSYLPPSSSTSQSFDVTFTGSSAPYLGRASISPDWHIPDEGDYPFATLSFTPPTASDSGSLTGTANMSQLPGEDDPLDWKADPSVPDGQVPKAARSAKY
jgi:hypothetical protein